MTTLPRIGIILGSLQDHGVSRRITTALQDILARRLALDIVEICDMPLYNPERDGESVPAWDAFGRAIAPSFS